ncbi:hypothetical protein OAM69_07480, partial [bacterium]|nr:hypothetical protein [bacterium]
MINKSKDKKDMRAITRNSQKIIGAGCSSVTAEKRKHKNAKSVRTCKRCISSATTISTAESTDRAAPTALAAAVNSALRVSRQQPFRYLLAATLMSTGAMTQAQGFPASINVQDLDGSN